MIRLFSFYKTLQAAGGRIISECRGWIQKLELRKLDVSDTQILHLFAKSHIVVLSKMFDNFGGFRIFT